MTESGEENILAPNGAFIFIGSIPHTSSFGDIVELNDKGFIKTSEPANTSVEGIIAAGDYRDGTIAQVAAATGEGVLASYGLREYFSK